MAVVAAVLTLVFVASGAWVLRQRAASGHLDGLFAEATRFADQDDYFAAFIRAREAERLAPEDERLPELWERIAAEGPIETDPPGAAVAIRDYRDADGAWTALGKTPIADTRLPRGVLRWRFELAGYDPLEFTAPSPGGGRGMGGGMGVSPGGRGVSAGGRGAGAGGRGDRGDSVLWGRLNGNAPVDLTAHGTVPAGMVLIRRPALGLTLAGYGIAAPFLAPDFLIDKYEVTNRQFQQFVAADGYEKREFWKHPFIKGTRTIGWEEAMQEFRDRTGRPGPSTWDAGTFPPGKDDFPVNGVSWYEAAAYAEFAGKSLPTVYHWLSAASTEGAAFITALSNIDGKAVAAVGTFKGVTSAGVFDMAGNVREWCWNAAAGNTRYHLGGSWADPSYMFTFGNARDPLDRSEMNGFRLAKYLEPPPPPTFAPIERPARDLQRTPTIGRSARRICDSASLRPGASRAEVGVARREPRSLDDAGRHLHGVGTL